MDTRRDHGEYYPGGGTRQGAPSAPGGGADASGKVDRVDLGVIADDASASEMRTAIQRIQRAMRPAVTALAVVCGVLAAQARTNAWDALRSGEAVVVEEEDAAALAEIVAAMIVLEARIASATNGVMAAMPTAPDLEPYATKAALAAATNAVMAAMPTPQNLEPYATRAWIGQQGFVTDAYLGMNFATKAWVNGLGFVDQTALDAFEGTVEARVGVVENAVAGSTNGLASKAWVEGKGYVTASVTNGLAKRAWVTEQSDAAKAHADEKLEEAKAYSDANRESAKEYARNLSYAAGVGNTRLVTEDGRTWQDATGTVWQVSDVWGWTGTAWTNNVSLPVTFYPDGSGTNWVSRIVGMRRLWSAGGDDPYMYLTEEDNPDATAMADAMGKATDTNLTWNSISPLLGEMSGRIELSKAVVALETNAVRHVAYTDTQGSGLDADGVLGIVGGFAETGTAFRASSVGNAETWVDATGCVWSVEKFYSDEWVTDSAGNYLVGWNEESPYPTGWYVYFYDTAVFEYGISENRYATVITTFEGIVFNRVLDHLGTNFVGRVALTNDIPRTAAQVGAFPSASGAALQNTVNAWQTYWDGDDVRVTVTNYYGSIDYPHLYIEQRMPADETHDEPWFKTIWDEMTRWNVFLSGYANLTNHVERDLADRAWGSYDSHTGDYSPDGFTSISSSSIMIAAGMAYQKTVTTDGEVWVLTATEPTTISGVTSNGFFRIEDGDGNALFEIIKGDKRTVGATAGSIRVTGDEVQIGYALADNSSVVISYTTDLKNGMWQNVEPTWTGTSGNYTAHVQKPNSPCAFFKATYEIGGETYIRNSAPVSTDRVVIGGNFYRVSVETVNGKKLMVLTDD